jgi:hypothetical protein
MFTLSGTLWSRLSRLQCRTWKLRPWQASFHPSHRAVPWLPGNRSGRGFVCIAASTGCSPAPQPDDIHNELLHQRTNKTRTLLVAIFASLLIASIAAGLTGAKWAYAWVLAELVLGSTRII